MKDSILSKLDTLSERYEEVGALLSDPETIADQNKYRDLSKEYAELEPVVKTYLGFQQVVDSVAEAKSLLKDADPDMREMAQEEMKDGEQQLEVAELELQRLLLPKDPNDHKNVFLEIRAGTGGDEAAIFSGDLFRMYSKFAETQRWQVEVVSENSGDHGGYKEIIARIVGKGVYSKLKFESGAHRVQRVPDTESQGRIHTSACTVAIMPEADEQDEIEINKGDFNDKVSMLRYECFITNPLLPGVSITAMKVLKNKVSRMFRKTRTTTLEEVPFKERQLEEIERVQRETKWQLTVMPVQYIV